MNIQIFNKKLQKIGALADNGNTEGQFSSLERDLLLSYIRELYDLVLDGKVHPAPAHQPSTPKVPHYQTPVIETTPSAPVAAEVEEVKTPLMAEIAKADIPPVVQEVKHFVPDADVVLPVMETLPIQTKNVKSENKEALAEIFADEKISDLSDKLALTPVKDLTKSMGINEKIFTQQELFGNNQEKFNETLVKLNGFQHFEEAKQYLSESIIPLFDWTNENKVKKAATFVKLVKRRFV